MLNKLFSILSHMWLLKFFICRAKVPTKPKQEKIATEIERKIERISLTYNRFEKQRLSCENSINFLISGYIAELKLSEISRKIVGNIK